jgi:hypothetical protein
MSGEAISPGPLSRRSALALLALAARGVVNAQSKPAEWQSMFDGKTLQGWR